MDIRRICLGVISAAFISVGLIAIPMGWDSVAFSVLLRSGLFMGAVWLALPDLTSSKSEMSLPVLIMSIVAIIGLAIRPRYLLVFGSLAVATFLLQGVVRRLIAGLRNK